MKRFMKVFFVAVIIFSFASCGGVKKDPFSFRNGQKSYNFVFRAENGLDFEGKIGVKNAENSYTVVLNYISPDSLAGVRVEVTNGVSTAYSGETAVTGADFLAIPAVFFLCDGEITEAGTEERNGKETAFLRTASSDKTFIIYFDPVSDEPFEITSGGASLFLFPAD